MNRSLVSLALLLVAACAFWLIRASGIAVHGTLDSFAESLPANGPRGTGEQAQLVMPRDRASSRTGKESARSATALAPDGLNLDRLQAQVQDGYRGEPAAFVTHQVIDRYGVEAIVTTEAEGRVQTDEYVARGPGQVRVVEGLGAPVFSRAPEGLKHPFFAEIRDEQRVKALRPRFTVSIGASGSDAGTEAGTNEWQIDSSRLVPVRIDGLPDRSMAVQALLSYQEPEMHPLKDAQDALGNGLPPGPIWRGSSHVLELVLTSRMDRQEMITRDGAAQLSPTEGFRSNAELAEASIWSAARAHQEQPKRVVAFIAQSETRFYVGRRWLPFHRQQSFLSAAPQRVWQSTLQGVVASQSRAFKRPVFLRIIAAASSPLDLQEGSRSFSVRARWKKTDGGLIGSCEFDGLPPGRYSLDAKGSGFEECTSHRQPIVIPDAQPPVHAAQISVLDLSPRKTHRVAVRDHRGERLARPDTTLTVSVQAAERVVGRLFHDIEREPDGQFLVTDRLPEAAGFSLALDAVGHKATGLSRSDLVPIPRGYLATVRLAAGPAYRAPTERNAPFEEGRIRAPGR